METADTPIDNGSQQRQKSRGTGHIWTSAMRFQGFVARPVSRPRCPLGNFRSFVVQKELTRIRQTESDTIGRVLAKHRRGDATKSNYRTFSSLLQSTPYRPTLSIHATGNRSRKH
jgi:hypothetical protein